MRDPLSYRSSPRFRGKVIISKHDDGTWIFGIRNFDENDNILYDGGIWVWCKNEPQLDYCVSAIEECGGNVDNAADVIAARYDGRSGYFPLRFSRDH